LTEGEHLDHAADHLKADDRGDRFDEKGDENLANAFVRIGMALHKRRMAVEVATTGGQDANVRNLQQTA
jgi:hypothetical protein